jgi:hypothetical protein
MTQDNWGSPFAAGEPPTQNPQDYSPTSAQGYAPAYSQGAPNAGYQQQFGAYPMQPVPGYGYQAALPPKPDTNIGWAIGALLMFWPLCIPAFMASSNVDSRYYAGDYQGSLQASEDAKKWGKWGVFIGVGLIAAVFIIYMIILIAVLSSI